MLFMEQGKSKLLVISTDTDLLANCAAYLEKHFSIEWASNEAMSHFLLREWEPLVVVVDAQSPMFKILKNIRQSANKKDRNDLGLVVVSRQCSIEKETFSFDCGADQFLLMPLQGKSFLARMRSLARRVPKRTVRPTPDLHPATRDSATPDQGQSESLKQQEPVNYIEFQHLKIFPQETIVKRDDQILNISPIQVRLLYVFLTNGEQLLSREFLKKTVWDNGEISPRSIDAQISKLKKAVPELEPFLVNIYGKGYLLTGFDKVA